MNKQDLFLLVSVFAANNPEGFTFNLHTCKAQDHGFAVARKETQDSFNAEGLESALNFALANNCACIGGWMDQETGKYYFDATEIYSNKEAAIKAGKLNGQIAIFDIDNLDEIRL